MSEPIIKPSGVRVAGLRFRRVLRWDPDMKMLRIARVLWESRSKRGHEIGHKLSVAVWPKLFRFYHDFCEFDLTVLGMRIHHISGGGRYA